MPIPTKRTKEMQVELALEALFAAAKRTDTTDMTGNFLRQTLTRSEQLHVGRRLLIAKYLLTGYSWSQIRFELQVSPNTIDLVQTWLKEQIPEYETAIKAQAAHLLRGKSEKKKKQPFDPNPLSWRSFKRKYPAHFLLWNLLSGDSD